MSLFHSMFHFLEVNLDLENMFSYLFDIVLTVRYRHNSHQFKSNPNNTFNKLLPFGNCCEEVSLSLEVVAITDYLFLFLLAPSSDSFFIVETKQDFK